ncbi:hypothetical protein V5O48_015624 [Marasmius crinis-equi]|uniref:F-box domain-containing protein n=1 Tax=Marasmius crinis-equi TaxID=585013 RepID=A0ABR3EU38_9AGAR
MSDVEETRLCWARVLVGSDYMKNQNYHSEIQLENNAGRNAKDAIPTPSYWRLVCLMHELFRSYAYPDGRYSHGVKVAYNLQRLGSDTYALRKDTVFRLHNHLDNPLSLHTGAYKLFQTVKDYWTTEDWPRVVYGFLFPALDVRCETFPFFLNKGSFPTGITAVARLASRIDVDFFDELEFPLESWRHKKPVRQTYALDHNLFDKLPPELLQQIALHINNIETLMIFADISPRNRLASRHASLSSSFLDSD